jgi:hypothetical protein
VISSQLLDEFTPTDDFFEFIGGENVGLDGLRFK